MAREAESMKSTVMSADNADEMLRPMVEARVRELIVAATANPSININMDAALYRTAGERNLGELKTDEVRFSLAGKDYIAQGFTDGILYVEDGQWGDIRTLDWPAPASSSTMSSSAASGGLSSEDSSKQSEGGLSVGADAKGSHSRATPRVA